MKLLSLVRLLATPWTVAYQASLSMGFSRQEYWSGVPLPSPVVDIRVCIIVGEFEEIENYRGLEMISTSPDKEELTETC